MEKLDFNFQSASLPQTSKSATLCGVVGSGNLEILIKPLTKISDNLEDSAKSTNLQNTSNCHIELTTSARGFKAIWQAVLEKFTQENSVGGSHIIIHDMGSTPAVVTLRLQQTLYQYLGVNQ